MTGDYDAGRESRGARSQALAQRNGIRDFQLNRRERFGGVMRHRKRRLPDEIGRIERNARRIAARGPNHKLRRHTEAAFQVDWKRKSQRIETRSEVGARSRDTQP